MITNNRGVLKYFYFLAVTLAVLTLVVENDGIRQTRKRVTRKWVSNKEVKGIKKRVLYDDERPLKFIRVYYSKNRTELRKNVDNWINSNQLRHPPPYAIIVPYCNLSLCGNISGTAFKQVDPTPIKRIFLLGPLHSCHNNFKKCMLTSYLYYRSPFGHIKIDTELIAKLLKNDHFSILDKTLDNEIYSLENVIPFISQIMKNRKFTLVPIIIPNLSVTALKAVSKILVKYLTRDRNFFIISSHLSHWKDLSSSALEVTVEKTVHKLNKQAIEAIESLEPNTFKNYLESDKRNIYVKQPILLFLEMAKILYDRYFVLGMKFLSDDIVFKISKNLYTGCAAGYFTIY